MAKLILIVDPQNDFINGSLPVPLAAEQMNQLSEYLRMISGIYAAKAVSCDWHPVDHCSFKENGGEWPRHCVSYTKGAVIWPNIEDGLFETKGRVYFLNKGTDPDIEEYSLFMSKKSAAQFDEIVKKYNITEVDVCGIVREICVMNTIKDLHATYPNMIVNVLMAYTPTLDSGVTFNKYLEENKAWLNPIV